jgi:hypothetical protein
MMSLPWNNFLRSLLHFVVVRAGHDEGLGRTSFRLVFLTLQWQKEEEGIHKKEEVSQLRLQECWPSFIGHIFSGLLPSVCLCGHPYETLYRFGFEIWSYSKRRYNKDKILFLDRCGVIQRACNVIMYTTIFYYNSSFVSKKKKEHWTLIIWSVA